MADIRNILRNMLGNAEGDADLARTSIIGQDPILPTPFLIGSATAISIAAIGVMANKLWVVWRE